MHEARSLMTKERIRHLPVTEPGLWRRPTCCAPSSAWTRPSESGTP